MQRALPTTSLPAKGHIIWLFSRRDATALSGLELPVPVAPFEVCIAAGEPGC